MKTTYGYLVLSGLTLIAAGCNRPIEMNGSLFVERNRPALKLYNTSGQAVELADDSDVRLVLIPKPKGEKTHAHIRLSTLGNEFKFNIPRELLKQKNKDGMIQFTAHPQTYRGRVGVRYRGEIKPLGEIRYTTKWENCKVPNPGEYIHARCLGWSPKEGESTFLVEPTVGYHSICKGTQLVKIANQTYSQQFRAEILVGPNEVGAVIHGETNRYTESRNAGLERACEATQVY